MTFVRGAHFYYFLQAPKTELSHWFKSLLMKCYVFISLDSQAHSNIRRVPISAGIFIRGYIKTYMNYW